MSKDPSQQVHLTYDRINNTIYIGAARESFDPKYLEYLLKYLGVPKDAVQVFISKEKPHE